MALAITDPVQRKAALTKANATTGERTVRMLAECAGVFAVLDGSDVDSGTAAEIGWAAALGRPIVGWRGDLRMTGDNEGAVVNLQVEHFVHQSGGCEASLDAAIAALRALLEHRPPEPEGGPELATS